MVVLLAGFSGCGFLTGGGGVIAFKRDWLSKLVMPVDGRLVPVNPERLRAADYVLFYYGANWCGPCHKAAPGVVDAYRRLKSMYPNFEVIFVSRDHSPEEMAIYMAKTGMPWPAVEPQTAELMPDVLAAGGSAIPAAVLVDRTGLILSSSSQGGKYVGVQPVLEELERLLKAPDAIPPTAATSAATPVVRDSVAARSIDKTKETVSKAQDNLKRAQDIQ